MLNPKQKLFVEAYLRNGGNATQAAISAGYSEKTAYAQGSRLLSHAEVSAAVATRGQKAVAKLEATTDDIIAARVRRAFFDPGELASREIRKPADIADLPEEVRRCIKGWKWDKDGRFIVEWADADASLSALEKIHGLYRENTASEGALNIVINLG